jgi:hypothetical protein
MSEPRPVTYARVEGPLAARSLAARLVYAGVLACCAALALLLRLPLLHVPLTNDEGGYAYVARLWAGGAALYHDAWVDRPQGLMLLFRLLVAVAPSTAGMRLFGGVYAVVNMLVLAYVGSRLYGRAVGLCVAALYAVFSSGPQIEGFIVNGELLATLPTVAAVALVLRAQRSARPDVWLILAGLAAGMALLVKQSAIDGVVVVALVAPAGAHLGGRTRVRRCALALLGVVTAVLLSALHGAATGWHEYLNAVVLDNLRYHSLDASSSGSLSQALEGVKGFWSEDVFLVVAALGAVAHIHRTRGILDWLPLPWLAAALCGVTLGGLYSRHYFVQVLPPLCVLAALGLVTGVQVARRIPLSGLLFIAPLAALLVTVRNDASLYVGSSPIAISQRLYGWTVYTHQAELVALLRGRVPAGAPFFVAYAAAPLHYLTGRPSVTRYLWRRPLGTVPGAYRDVLRTVERAEPVCIVTVQAVAQPPGDEHMRAAIARHYVLVWKQPGAAVYCRPVRSEHSAAEGR